MKYKVAIAEGGDISIAVIPIDFLISKPAEGDEPAEYEDCEFVYALMEMVEPIIRMRLGESRVFKPSRDNEDSKGIIMRIQ